MVAPVPRSFAGRLRREAGDDVGRQVERAYRLAFGRPPDADEVASRADVRRRARPGRVLPGAVQRERVPLRRLRADGHHDAMPRLRADRPDSARLPRPAARPAWAGWRWRTLLARDGTARGGRSRERRPTRRRTTRPRPERAIHIFLHGGLSQVDSFDYKPELIRRHGQAMPVDERPDVFFGKVGRLHRPHWAFRQRGQSGLWVSDLFPHLAECADELTVIRSMVAETANHTPATFEANTGFRVMGFPALGAWLSYGLGSETDDLPTFVVLPDARGLPSGGASNWTSGFLPARHQGVAFRTPRAGDPRPVDPASPVDADARGHATSSWPR